MTIRDTKKLEVFPKRLPTSHTKTIYTITTYPNIISSLSLPPKIDKLTLTLTPLTLTDLWKTRSKLHFDDTIIHATNVITNIKHELKNIILTHYKHRTINNTLHEFQSNFCINNAICTLTQNSITMLF